MILNILQIMLIIAAMLAILDIRLTNISYGTARVKFYQVWLKDEFLSSNFFIITGKETKKGLETHNNILLSKDMYRYAILPFINVDLTNRDIRRMDETDYINMCLKMTNESLNEYEKAE